MKKPSSFTEPIPESTALNGIDTPLATPSAASPTSLAEAQAQLAEAVAQQAALRRENQLLRAAQQELAVGEARLRAAEAVAGIGSYELDLVTGTFHFSEGLYHLLGEAPGSFAPSLAWLDARSDPANVAAVRRILDQAVQLRQPYHYHRRVRRADGQWRTLLSHGRVVCDAAGAVVRFEGVVEDKTEQQQAEQELLTAKERLQVTLDSSLYVVQAFEAVRDAAGRIVDFTWVFVNRAWQTLHGNSVGKRLLTENPGVVVNGLFELFVQVTETGVPVDHEHYYSHEQFDGWFHQTLVQLGDGFVMHTEDINARKQAEQELRAGRELLQATLDSSLAMVQVFRAVRNEQGNIVDFTWILNNRVSEERYGNVVGQRLLTHNPGVVEAGIFDTFKQVVETGQPDQRERHYVHEQFNGWFYQSTVKLHDGVATTTTNISERKQAEQELRRTLGLLEQSELVAELGNWDYELATGTLRWSAGMYRLYGVAPNTPVQPALYLEYVVAADRPAAERVVQALTTAPADIEETLRLRVGQEEKTVRLKAVLLYEAGQPVRLLGVDLDISQVQHLAADNLRLRLEQQQALFEAVQAAQEEERKRIAEALHNGVGQLLFATKLRLDQLYAPTPATAPALTEASHLLSEAIRQTRSLSHELVPLVLKEFGLVAALQDLCRKPGGPPLRFECQIELDNELLLPASLQLAVYRIAQELVQNIVKHAHGATEASLELETVPGFVLLRAVDNGPGFAPGAPKQMSLGLRSIRDRVALLGGLLDMGSIAGAGAYVRIRLPLPSPVGAAELGK